MSWLLPWLLGAVSLSHGAEDATPPPSTEVPPEATSEVQIWAGTLTVVGSRRIPLLGKVEYRTDTNVLARVTPAGPGRYEVDQATCAIHFPKTLGAEVSIDPSAPSKMPHATLTWTVDDAGEWRAGPWQTGWDATDHDNDGEPGITFHVDAPFCGGRLFMSSEASQTATGRPREGFVVVGDIQIHVEQKILGTRGPCLNLMTRDTIETMDGRFAFVQQAPDATCDAIQQWPDPLDDA